MFGYPTGVGALLIRRSAFAKLRRPWFAGGTVNFAFVQGRAHVFAPNEAGRRIILEPTGSLYKVSVNMPMIRNIRSVFPPSPSAWASTILFIQ
jgi:hypothetical protein